MTDRERLLKTRDVLRQFRKDYGECCNLLAGRTLERDRLQFLLWHRHTHHDEPLTVEEQDHITAYLKRPASV